MASVQSSPLASPGENRFRSPGQGPLPPKRVGSLRRTLLWIAIPLGFMGLTFAAGRTIEPVRHRLVSVPLVGPLLFRDPVWPILWNRTTASDPRANPADGKTASLTMETKALTEMQAKVAGELADVAEQRRKLQQREEALIQERALLAQQTQQLALVQKETDDLRTRVLGQYRTDQDRVKVVSTMKIAAVVQLFGALTDAEAISILKYLEPQTVGKVLAALDPTRSARLLRNLVPSTGAGAGS